MEHKTINGAGGEVHYWISRPKETSKGAIVFTHGVTADHTMFEKQVEFFEKEYTVITWDVPLHGLSVDYRDFSFTNTAKDLNMLFWYINKRDDIHKEEINKLSEAVNNNTLVMQKLLDRLEE